MAMTDEQVIEFEEALVAAADHIQLTSRLFPDNKGVQISCGAAAAIVEDITDIFKSLH